MEWIVEYTFSNGSQLDPARVSVRFPGNRSELDRHVENAYTSTFVRFLEAGMSYPSSSILSIHWKESE